MYALLAEQLDGARYVRFDAVRGFVLAWFGGHGCHAYSAEDGQEVAFWNIGDFAQNEADFEEVREDFEEHLQSGEYLELY